MLLLKRDELYIREDRQRREFDEGALQELANSIGNIGLQNAIVVRPRAEGGYWLVSGERRVRAIESLHFLSKTVRYGALLVTPPLLPCVDHGELDEIKSEEAELDENIKRKDLTWQERATATARVQNLRRKQLAVAEASGDHKAIVAAEKAVSVAAIAETVRESSLGVNQETTRRELIVAKHLQSNPEVAKAKTIDDAFKILKRQEDVRRNVDLAASVGATFTVDLHKAFNTDSLAWMGAYTGEHFDVILTDPPYGMGADQFGDSGGVAAGAHTYDDSYESWKKTMGAFAPLSYKITKAAAHLYAFCDFDRFHELKQLLEVEGWNCFRTPLVWHNPDKARTPWVDFGPQRKFELCLYANKGRKPVTKIFPDLVTYRSDDNMGHHAQKPVDLFIDLLRRSVVPGDLVLDPFAGSGVIFPAAHQLKVQATGIELAPEHYALCLKRLEKLRAEPELPLSNPLTDLRGLK